MGFHKHGSYSFSIAVQKMSLIGGDRFVADLTGLRWHAITGTATSLDLPLIPEHYGETAQDAEHRAIQAVCGWIDEVSHQKHARQPQEQEAPHPVRDERQTTLAPHG